MSDEQLHERVYGGTFALYERQDMLEFIEPLRVRFERNGLDAAKIFADKRCLDAGCGNGRGALFMLQSGARSVEACDISKKNVQSARGFLAEFGFADRSSVRTGFLEDIPLPDQSFDFVWCNGVIQHTKNPNKCLSELARVLKTGGQCWLYIYGSGGVYWRVIQHLRRLVEPVSIETCIDMLTHLGYPTAHIAEFVDDWYTPFLRTYTHADLTARLTELGFEPPELLKHGMDYDTSHRRNRFPGESEKHLMGEGDLRYLLTKTSHHQRHEHPLGEGALGSEYTFPKVLTDNIDPPLKEIRQIATEDPQLRVAVAAKIQRKIRTLLSTHGNLRISSIARMLDCILGEMKESNR